MRALALNSLVAAIWLFLSPRRSLVDLLIGFVVGFALLAVFGRVLNSGAYARRVIGLVRFGLHFAGQFFLANLSVAALVLTSRRESLHPNFVTYDVSELTFGEALALGYCITLTPGTTTVHMSEDGKTLILHAIDVQDAAELRRKIDVKLKEPLLRATR
jgi:multicomponent Na+:H+ antiporter subunit E